MNGLWTPSPSPRERWDWMGSDGLLLASQSSCTKMVLARLKATIIYKSSKQRKQASKKQKELLKLTDWWTRRSGCLLLLLSTLHTQFSTSMFSRWIVCGCGPYKDPQLCFVWAGSSSGVKSNHSRTHSHHQTYKYHTQNYDPAHNPQWNNWKENQDDEATVPLRNG